MRMLQLKTNFDTDSMNAMATEVIGAAIAVHKTIGAGHLKETYLACWVYELRERGFKVEVNQSLPVQYKNLVLTNALILDIVVEDTIVLEPFSMAQNINEDHVIAMVNKLRYADMPLALLINFNMKYLKGDAIKRVKM